MRLPVSRTPSRVRHLRRGLLLAALVACPVAAGCVHIIQSARVEDMPPATLPDTLTIVSPVKAHLGDGSTVLFRNGARIERGMLRGLGTRHFVNATVIRRTDSLPLDSIAAMESFRTDRNMPATVLVSSLSVAVTGVAAAFATAGLLVAIFGSCPTVYADSAGHAVLQAEGFSYSIAPLFERRDVDHLRVQADSSGRLSLEVRNEALETHYLNHFELLEVRHRAGEIVAPDESGRPVVLGALRPAATATDRAGRDVAAALRAPDGTLFATARTTLAAASAADLEDHVDLAFAPSDADSVALRLRLRNSLLNTVLLYDQILGASGARSIDWLGADLQKITTAIDLGRWYVDRMGMRIAVHDGTGYRQVARIGDTGPIAFHDVAVVVPARAGDSVRVRLSFTADNWRIDEAAVAERFSRAEPRAVPVAEVLRDDGTRDSAALASVRDPDESYLTTQPGQYFTMRFAPGAISRDSTRSFLLASQGYYIEWVRGEWVRTASRRTPFTPGDEALAAALDRWRNEKPDFESRFYASKIPVR